MPQGKHRATHRASSTRPRLKVPAGSRLAYVAAPLATVSVVGAGIVIAGQSGTGTAPAEAAAALGQAAPTPRSTPAPLPSVTAHALSSSAVTGASRSLSISRDLDRLAVPDVTAHRWTTAPLDLRFAPGAHVATDGVFDAGKRIAISGVERNGYAEVVVDHQARWVTATYLSTDKPAPQPADLPLGSGPCAGTSGVESGLVSAADRVYEAVCHNFPEITTYGGYDPHGEHSSGKAIDIMTSDVGLGTRIAEFLQAHAAELDLYDIIWRQHIWTPVRASEGWRAMPDRGSATANHDDHVHVSVN